MDGFGTQGKSEWIGVKCPFFCVGSCDTWLFLLVACFQEHITKMDFFVHTHIIYGCTMEGYTLYYIFLWLMDMDKLSRQLSYFVPEQYDLFPSVFLTRSSNHMQKGVKETCNLCSTWSTFYFPCHFTLRISSVGYHFEIIIKCRSTWVVLVCRMKIIYSSQDKKHAAKK